MYKQLVYRKLCIDPFDVLKHFKLSFLLENQRTSIYENDYMRLSIDKRVFRVFVFDGNDEKLVEEIDNYFYGDVYE